METHSKRSVFRTAAKIFAWALGIYLGPFLVLLCDALIFRGEGIFSLIERSAVMDILAIIYKPLLDLLFYFSDPCTYAA